MTNQLDPFLVYKTGPLTVLGFGGRVSAPKLRIEKLRDPMVKLLHQEQEVKKVAIDLSGVTTLTDSLCEFVDFVAKLPGLKVKLYGVKDKSAAKEKIDSRVFLSHAPINVKPPPDVMSFPSFKVQGGDGFKVITITPKVVQDPLVISQLLTNLTTLLDANSGLNFLIDFSNVTMLGSSALAALAKFHKQVKKTGGQLVICSLNSGPLEVIATTGLDKLFTLKDSVADAIDSMS